MAPFSQVLEPPQNPGRFNSMGGYAALVVGSLLNAQNVLAFVPQTFISRWLRMRYLDRRWVKKIRYARTRPSALAEAFDLRSFLGEPGYINATIFYDQTHRLDAAHANRLKHLPNTHIESVDGGHKAIQKLRDSGRLAEILRQTTTDDSLMKSNMAVAAYLRQKDLS